MISLTPLSPVQPGRARVSTLAPVDRVEGQREGRAYERLHAGRVSTGTIGAAEMRSRWVHNETPGIRQGYGMSGNFESGPVKLTKSDTPLRWEDAAKRVTVAGWSCVQCERFYGDGDGAERAARYCCHDNAPCDCGGRKPRHRNMCDSCWHKERIRRWEAMEQVDSPAAPSSDCPLFVGDGDTYFFDIDDLLDYCGEHEIKPSDAFLVLCKPHNPPPFSLSEHLNDYLPGEEGEMPGDPSEWREVEKAVDNFVERHKPFSWYPDNKRRPTDANLAALDSEYAKETTEGK